MAKKSLSAAFSRGTREAETAIEEDRAFWVVTDDEDNEDGPDEHIDPHTGLPYIFVSGEADDYVRGYNEAILKAFRAGKLKTDFRPLLMSRAQIVAALKRKSLGVLSLDNPLISAPKGEFALEIKLPRSKKPKHIWISFRNREQDWPQWELFDEDDLNEIGIGRAGKVMIAKTSCLYLTYDVRTTQILDRYIIDDEADADEAE